MLAHEHNLSGRRATTGSKASHKIADADTFGIAVRDISTVEFATLSWRTLLGVDWGLILPKAESWNSPPMFAASPCEMSSVGCAAGIPVRPPLSEGPGSSADASASGVAGAAGGVAGASTATPGGEGAVHGAAAAEKSTFDQRPAPTGGRFPGKPRFAFHADGGAGIDAGGGGEVMAATLLGAPISRAAATIAAWALDRDLAKVCTCASLRPRVNSNACAGGSREIEPLARLGVAGSQSSQSDHQ
jgi:hypothetical protein